MSPARHQPDRSVAGQQFLAEIREQPAALRRLLEQDEAIASVADSMCRHGTRLIRLVGHGSSDNAASYGVYVFGLLAGLTAIRDSISLSVDYHAPLDMTGETAIGISQSGRTPDVVAYLLQARKNGAFTVALTNDPDSDIAMVADVVVPLSARDEGAVAATKTYLNSIAALALIAGRVARDGERIADGIWRAAESLERALPELEGDVETLVGPFVSTGRMFVIGRGVELATAREIALKLLETCYVAAEPLTSTGLAHGPIAALDPLFPVWAVASDDEMLQAVEEAATRVRQMGAPLVASGTAAHRLDASYCVPTPGSPMPVLSPLLSVAPGQLFAWALARAKGLDPDRPRGLAKITLAR